MHPRTAWHRGRLAPGNQPALHRCDLRLLLGTDLGGELFDVRVGRFRLGEGGHLHGLLVVRDHYLGEHRVDVVEGRVDTDADAALVRCRRTTAAACGVTAS